MMALLGARFIDWIWHIRGSLVLPPGQSGTEAFDRLDPLFRQTGTRHERTNDTLTFSKKDQDAQDKMSIFDGGVLQIENGVAAPVLHYRLASKALLACFLAPLLFLSFAGLTIAVAHFQKPTAEEAAAQKQKAEAAEKKKGERQLHPIDKFLGAPSPEKPKKSADKSKREEKEDEGPSPTSAYVFAALFALLYAGGRVLEDRLVKSLFRKRLLGS